MKYTSFVSLLTITYIKLKVTLISSFLDSSSLIIKFIAIKAYSSLSVCSNISSL